METPKLRQASIVSPLYPLNQFPQSFHKSVAQQVFAIKATSLFSDKEIDITGNLWEQIFASSIGAKRDSAIALGIDDIQDQKTSTAWSAKTVKWTSSVDIVAKIRDHTAKVQLISGRNSPDYSFDFSVDRNKTDPAFVGKLVLEIWNERIKSVRTKFSNLRTVVMVKCPNLGRVVIFEKETELYRSDDFRWEWNSNKNLNGFDGNKKMFTWQPHGSQFTLNDVAIPQSASVIDIGDSKKLSKDDILTLAGWSDEKFRVM